MPKNIFHSVILLVCISLAFVGNAYSFIHPVGEEEYEILVSYKKVKRKGIKKGEG